MADTLADCYRITSKLGDGGFASVYRAEDRVLGRTVAVKIPQEQYAADPDFRQRFFREARAVASLSHPHVVGLFDMGESDGRPFLVMEYVEGPSLKELLRQGPLPVAQALEIASQTCEAVAAAHARGIVHCDIKPQNILLKVQSPRSPAVGKDTAPVLSAAGSIYVKLTDFGIARVLGSATASVTSQVLGSIHYLAPEQTEGKAATIAGDIYSLGVVLYEMLAGQPPFDGETVVGIAMQHVRQAPPPLRQLNPSVSPMLESIALKALAKLRNPESATCLRRKLGERFESAGSWRKRLPRLCSRSWETGLPCKRTPPLPHLMPPPTMSLCQPKDIRLSTRHS